jgi:hypothetical protein
MAAIRVITLMTACRYKRKLSLAKWDFANHCGGAPRCRALRGEQRLRIHPISPKV